MSEENVERAYQAADAFNRRDLDALLALCDPNIEFHSRLTELEGGRPYRGHDGIRSWWESLFAISLDFSSEIEDVREAGDTTVVRVRQRGHGLGSDAPIDQTHWMVTKWRHKKGVWCRIYLSEAEALEAAGLRE
jgi:ketosteroid isomerase-like protein